MLLKLCTFHYLYIFTNLHTFFNVIPGVKLWWCHNQSGAYERVYVTYRKAKDNTIYER